MGYIFDALNRSAPDGEPDQPQVPDTPGTHPPGTGAPGTDASGADAIEAADAGQPQRGGDEANAYESVAGYADAGDFADSFASDPDFNPLPAGPPLGLTESAPATPGAPETPGTPGAVEPIVTSRHIELSERRLKKMDDRIVMLTDPGCQFAEEYRSIRTSLLARWQNKRNLAHVITSATPQEGKTITSLNLGLTLAELRSRRTVIVEADLRLPAFANLLKLDPGPGLVPYLRGEVSLEEATQRVGDDGAYLLAAGDRAFDDAVSLLSSARMHALVELLRQRFDHVIIDTPPVIELADAGVLGGLADDVLLIARMRRTSRRLIDQAIKTLSSYNAPVGGVIATDHQPGFGRYYAYRYRYRYRYGYRSRYHDYRQRRKAA